MEYLICALIGYLLGCFSTSYFIGKLKGFDIRQKGTGNAGASNITISLGWKWGVVTALVDILKGFLAVCLTRRLFPDLTSAPFIGGCAATLGHIFPFYLKFKGGKGYATFTGMVLGLNWKLALFVMLWGTVVTLVSDYIALATISSAVLVAVYFIIKGCDTVSALCLIFTAAVIVYKHKINIIRMLHHEEIGLRDSGKHRVK